MYKLHLTSQFINDTKKLSTEDLEHTMEVLDRLCKNEVLEKQYKDHKLKGKLQGIRDCHIKYDLVLFYKKDKKTLILFALRIGTHSQLGI